MVPVCDKRYHIYNRFRHFWAEIKKLWNYPFNSIQFSIYFSMDLSTARPKWRHDGQALSGHLLFSTLSHAYANRYHHHLVR